MYCRLIEATSTITSGDSRGANVEENVVPQVKQLQGFRGAYWMGNSEGRIYAATFFDNQEALDATRDRAQAIRERGMNEGGVQFVGVKEFEVLGKTGGKISSSAKFARVNRSQIDVGRREESARALENVLIPQLKELDGFEGGFWLNDAATGEGMGVTLWESAEAIDSTREAAATLRQRMSQETGVVINPEGTFEVFARAETPAGAGASS